MANMSYCRFQNTLLDLQDCMSHLEDAPEDLSDDERIARAHLIELCANVACDYAECQMELSQHDI